jgi:hypothetical protein
MHTHTHTHPHTHIDARVRARKLEVREKVAWEEEVLELRVVLHQGKYRQVLLVYSYQFSLEVLELRLVTPLTGFLYHRSDECVS